MKTLKYQEEIDRLGGLDSDTHHEVNDIVFRYTKEDLSHPDTFLPVARLDPRRNKNVGSWGISLYRSREKAIARHKKLCERSPNIHKQIGDHISEGEIVPDHGVVSREDDNSHINLYEYQDVQLVNAFYNPERIL